MLPEACFNLVLLDSICIALRPHHITRQHNNCHLLGLCQFSSSSWLHLTASNGLQDFAAACLVACHFNWNCRVCVICWGSQAELAGPLRRIANNRSWQLVRIMSIRCVLLMNLRRSDLDRISNNYMTHTFSRLSGYLWAFYVGQLFAGNLIKMF